MDLDNIHRDSVEMAQRIQQLITGRLGLSMAVSRGALIATIRQYAEARQWWGPYHVRIDGPRDAYIPEGWTAHYESVWQWWLSDKISVEVWESAVTGPVFGTDIRVWERNGTEWREELLTYLPHWCARSLAVVSRVDPSPEEEVDADGGGAEEVDPYQADHAGKGGRRRR
jgi:hypothetical protein